MTNRVLLVVSDPWVRQAVREAVVGHGFEVVEVDDGARALAFLRKGALFAPPTPTLTPSLLVSSKDLARKDKKIRDLPSTTLRPAVVASGDVDLIIIDWSLPGLSGAEVLARLRGDGDDRPVIVLTSNATVDDAATMLALGADDVVSVPVNPRMLVARAAAQLRRRRSASLSSGEVLDKRYRLLDSLGEGRAGVVWRAQHLELDVDVDIAIVGTRGSEVLRHDAARAGLVVHPGLLRLRDIARLDNARHIVVADTLPGTSLRTLLLDHGGALPAERAFSILLQILDVIVAMHDAGIAHRNITPNSVFVDVRVGVGSAPDTDHVTVVDGGTLRLLSTSRRRVGNASYVPAEATGVGPGFDVDVYAAGRLACQLLTGSVEQLPKHALTPALAIAVAASGADRCSARALLRAVALVGRSRRRKDALSSTKAAASPSKPATSKRSSSSSKLPSASKRPSSSKSTSKLPSSSKPPPLPTAKASRRP